MYSKFFQVTVQYQTKNMNTQLSQVTMQYQTTTYISISPKSPCNIRKLRVYQTFMYILVSPKSLCNIRQSRVCKVLSIRSAKSDNHLYTKYSYVALQYQPNTCIPTSPKSLYNIRPIQVYIKYSQVALQDQINTWRPRSPKWLYKIRQYPVYHVLLSHRTRSDKHVGTKFS